MDLTKEWNFIKREIHGEKPSKDNRLKRELLFVLQIMLSDTKSTDISDYNKLKEIYLGI